MTTVESVTEEMVQTACEAIYREFDGYWPSDHERARIRVALSTVTDRWMVRLCPNCGAQVAAHTADMRAACAKKLWRDMTTEKEADDGTN